MSHHILRGKSDGRVDQFHLYDHYIIRCHIGEIIDSPVKDVLPLLIHTSFPESLLLRWLVRCKVISVFSTVKQDIAESIRPKTDN
ncbi:hypothetical protein RRG08_030062 [Elysia crispata]|uniref:Uncharacterized protein n=1 Tax=Elysia crispata TaxID=231223 RepID=A0AAE0YJV2_9GAST|nr:hypothetical protein RRG08_030062 [Elysia crispata]